MSDFRTAIIMKELSEVIQFLINHYDNQPETDFCDNVDKLINLNADLHQANGAKQTEKEALNTCDVNIKRELLFAFIKDWKEEFKDENWDYLDFMAERFLGKQ